MSRPLLLERKIDLDQPYAPLIEVFEAAGTMAETPNALYDATSDVERGISATGAAYFGPQAYSLLAGLTNFALPNGLLNVGHLHDEATKIIAASGGRPSVDERDRLHMLQWMMINHHAC